MKTSAPESSRISDIISELKNLAGREAELAKSELKPAAKHAVVGSGLFGGAAVFAMHALWLLLIAGALFIGWLYHRGSGIDIWPAFILGFVTMAAFILLVAGILALIGRSRISRVRKPEATIAELRATAEMLSSTLRKENTPALALDVLPDDDAMPIRSS